MNRHLQAGTYIFRITDPQLLTNINFYEKNRDDTEICIPLRLHISFSSNLDNDSEHHVLIQTVPEKKAQIDIDDDIQIALTFGDDVIRDSKQNIMKIEKDYTKLAEQFRLVDIHSNEVQVPTNIILGEFEDEIELKLIWSKDLFDNEKRAGYGLQLDQDENLYNQHNLHQKIENQVVIE